MSEVAHKERPILFAAPMVRAILDGSKTQTRRAVKPQPPADAKTCGPNSYDGPEGPSWFWGKGTGHYWPATDKGAKPMSCPYGRVGDRLWVRETWRPRVVHSCHPSDACDCDDVSVLYAADGGDRYFGSDIPSDWTMPKAAKTGNVTPLHMPRWASRITLEITNVRVERLNEISEGDAIAEGMIFTPRAKVIGGQLGPLDESGPMRNYYVQPDQWSWRRDATADESLSTARYAFGNLWESINGKGSWSANPWVWAITFRRVEAHP